MRKWRGCRGECIAVGAPGDPIAPTRKIQHEAQLRIPDLGGCELYCTGNGSSALPYRATEERLACLSMHKYPNQ